MDKTTFKAITLSNGWVLKREKVCLFLVSRGSSWGNRTKFILISNTKERLGFHNIYSCFETFVSDDGTVFYETFSREIIVTTLR